MQRCDLGVSYKRIAEHLNVVPYAGHKQFHICLLVVVFCGIFNHTSFLVSLKSLSVLYTVEGSSYSFCIHLVIILYMSLQVSQFSLNCSSDNIKACGLCLLFVVCLQYICGLLYGYCTTGHY